MAPSDVDTGRTPGAWAEQWGKTTIHEELAGGETEGGAQPWKADVGDKVDLSADSSLHGMGSWACPVLQGAATTEIAVPVKDLMV